MLNTCFTIATFQFSIHATKSLCLVFDKAHFTFDVPCALC